ncbi:L,D-transpeptidase [Oenococcus kitaharae]|uniref:D-alanyl-D-alanine carboxypeptidase n=1 Tax=Oenococcus kitaharae DSM 17330 TaxID=1045004 RepID=G9WET6_9LACO|nr:L,D-transpeptidase [Oenococcus kitaharae]EHN58259.1 D-alanyl-D-alanine carboxypeptidase [Oenococcus kitaharae DSM 17330]OEY81562.1 cell surface protein [Oenococcus kitaharae]OEY83048.1 cell surface protein [Oenococcus kitaharae]OEY84406.1 cell surface protein [Oenococcus kitaharae]
MTRRKLIVLSAWVILLAAFLILFFVTRPKTAGTQSQSSSVQSQTSQAAVSSRKKTAPKVLPAKIDWQAASEKKAYPVFSENPGAWVQVSLKEQLVYVKAQDGRTLYTMYCSSGLDNTTPTGTFYIQAERGPSFFNPSLNEGANYWVSFKDHGVYLFHSVPTSADKSYNAAEAEKLGHPASHGCIRLTVSDAKWFYENVPFNTKVVIGD